MDGPVCEYGRYAYVLHVSDMHTFFALYKHQVIVLYNLVKKIKSSSLL
jgi:hypothetical protein